MLLETQVKFLIAKGTHISNIDREGQPVALYSLGKRFYEMTFNNYEGDEITHIDEISPENALQHYFHNNV